MIPGLHIQLEEGVGNLQHEDMRVVVLMADQDAFTGTAHTMLCVVFFEPLQARQHRGVFFWLAILGAECVVAQRIELNGLGLVRVEVLGDDWPVFLVRRAAWYTPN